MRLNLRPLPVLLLTKRILIQWERPNMVPFNLALEANNLGRILDLFLALVLVDLVLLLIIGLLVIIGVESKSTLVIGKSLHTQHIIKCGLLMTCFQVFLQRSDLGLELFYFLYMVSDNTSTRGSRCFIVRSTRHGNQFITRCRNIMSG